MRFSNCSGCLACQRILTLITYEQIQFRNLFLHYFHTAQRQAGVVRFHD